MDKTLLKGLTVLETLARSRDPRGVSDLADELGLPKSNIHRTLQTLCEAGYVVAAGRGSYECSLKLFELGSAVAAKIDIHAVAEPLMRDLVAMTRETVHLSVLDGADVVYLHKVDSPEPVRAYSQTGGRAPAHCVASGKALLAYQSRAVLDALPETLPRFTGATIDSRADLLLHLAQVRAQGHAINHGEWREAVGGAAAIVLSADGRPAASLGISGPLDRIEPNLTAHITRVVDAARRVSELLGCRTYHQRLADWRP